MVFRVNGLGSRFFSGVGSRSLRIKVKGSVFRV